MNSPSDARRRPSPSATYRPDIDGLRAISILAVVLFHAFPGRFPAGFVGVDVFFVISGYLIGGLIVDELAEGRFTFARFYARRIRRIFPSLIVVLLAVYVTAWFVLFPGEFRQLGRHIAGAALFLSNFVLLDEAGYFDASSSAKLLLHLWSLAIEEQFYLVWPLLCFVAWRRRFDMLALTLAVLAGSFAVNILTADPATDFYSPLSRFWELNTGTAVALLQRRGGRFSHASWSDAVNGLVTLAGVVLLAAAFVLPKVETYPGWWALLPVGGSALLIAARPDFWIHRHILASRPFVFVGLISYPLYMWHWPVLSYAWILHGGIAPAWVRAAAVVASFALAWATYAFVERPIRFAPNIPFRTPALIGAVVLASVAGLVAMQQDGFQNRPVALLNRALEKDLRIPLEARMSDGSCERLLGVRTQGDEVCLANSARPRLLFIGDSHSMAMFNAIYEKTVDIPAVLIAAHSFIWARPGCRPSTDFPAWREGKDTCHDVIRHVFDVIGRVDSIEAVVIVPFAGNPFFNDRTVMGALQSFAEGKGKQTVYVLSVPSFMAPSACVTRTVDFFGYRLTAKTTPGACTETRSSIDEESKPQRLFIGSMIAGDAKAHLYDPLPVFCDDRQCRQSDTQGPLFWSTWHVNLRGSERLLQDFLRWAGRAISFRSGA